MEELKQQLTELKSAIFGVANSIWGEASGHYLEPVETISPQDEDALNLTGCIRINGGWNGAVILECTSKLATWASKSVLYLDLDGKNSNEVADALGELVNMTGGNIKALLPGPSMLSLPVVANGTDVNLFVPGSEPFLTLKFKSDGEPLVISLVKQFEE